MYTINKIPIRDKSADFKVLEKSSEFLFEKLKIDENNPDLYDQFSLRVDQSGGHRYFVDYRYLFGQMFEDNEFISFPDKINDLLEAVEVSSLMGLLPEINRAYITIDNKLYLWNYNNSNELEVFDGLSEVILSVSLSTPRAGIFVDSIKYILVIATSVEIIPTSYNISTDGVSMVKLCGSSIGRVFMAGSDGNLYELDYDNEENIFNIFSNNNIINNLKCQKINHTKWRWRLIDVLPPFLKLYVGGDDPLVDLAIDNIREVLYTISLKGYLSIYSINSNKIDCIVYRYNIHEYSRKHLSGYSSEITRNQMNSSYSTRIIPESSPKPDNFKDVSNISIVNLSTISITESKKCHLLIVLSNGIRIYIKLLYYSSRNVQGIEISYIRSPPTIQLIESTKEDSIIDSNLENGLISTNIIDNNLIKYNKCYYNNSVLLSSISYNNNEYLLVIYNDLMSHNHTYDVLLSGQLPNLREGIQLISNNNPNNLIDFKIHDIKEINSYYRNYYINYIQTLFYLSTTPVISAIREEESKYTNQNLMFNSMSISNYVSPTVSSILLPHGNGQVYGIGGDNAIENTILINDFLSTHIPTYTSTNIANHRKFMYLSTYGLSIISKFTPVDYLLKILSIPSNNLNNYITNNNISNDPIYLNKIKIFFDKYGIIQSSILCLGIYIGLPNSTTNVYTDGQDSYVDSKIVSNIENDLEKFIENSVDINPLIAQRAIQAMHKYTDDIIVQLPTFPTNNTNINSNPLLTDNRLISRGSQNIDYNHSPKIDALFQLTSRLIRPIYNRAIIKDNHINSYLSNTLVDSINIYIIRLRNYIKDYYYNVIQTDISKYYLSSDTTNNQSSNISNSNSNVYSTNNLTSNLISNLSINYTNQSLSTLLTTNSSNNPTVNTNKANKKLDNLLICHLYQLLNKISQTLYLISYLIVYNKQNRINFKFDLLNNLTFHNWVVSSKTFDIIKYYINNYITSLYHINVLISNRFVYLVSKYCYSYYNQCSYILYDNYTNIQNLISYLTNNSTNNSTSHENITNELNQIITNYLQAVKLFQSKEFIIPNNYKSTSSNVLVSELKKICQLLFDISYNSNSIYVGIVDICLSTCLNFYDLTTTSTINKSNRNIDSYNDTNDIKSVNESLDSLLYQGRYTLTSIELNQIINECYNVLNEFILLTINRYCDNISIDSSISKTNKHYHIVIDMIDHIISTCTDSKYYKILYDLLFNKKYYNILIEIKLNQELENYLRTKDTNLLYKHFEFHQQYYKSSELMGSLAKATSPVDILIRVNYLRAAIQSILSALKLPKDQLVISNQSFSLKEYEDLLDVAEIQLEMCQRLSTIPYSTFYPVNNYPILIQLKSQLLDVSVLYNDIAIPCKIWDSCLFLLQISNYNDSNIISRLWKSLIYRIIPSDSNITIGKRFLSTKRNADVIDIDENSVNTTILLEDFNKWFQILVNSFHYIITYLHRQTIKSQFDLYTYIPLQLILKEFEDLSTVFTLMEVQSLSRCWYLNSLLVIQCIDFDYLIDQHISLYDIYRNERNELVIHMLSSSTYLIKFWIDSVNNSMATSSSQSKQLLNAILSGRVSNWLDVLRKQYHLLSISSLGKGKSIVDSTINRLLNDVSDDLSYIHKKILEATII